MLVLNLLELRKLALGKQCVPVNLAYDTYEDLDQLRDTIMVPVVVDVHAKRVRIRVRRASHPVTKHAPALPENLPFPGRMLAGRLGKHLALLVASGIAWLVVLIVRFFIFTVVVVVIVVVVGASAPGRGIDADPVMVLLAFDLLVLIAGQRCTPRRYTKARLLDAHARLREHAPAHQQLAWTAISFDSWALAENWRPLLRERAFWQALCCC